MASIPEGDPTRRFSGLAAAYARFRPSYPDAAVDFALLECGLGPGSFLVDVGCGTGISSRLFAARGLQVVGIEPNNDMRAVAESEPVPDGVRPPVYHAGRAEATGLPDASTDAVLAAQAFHWFEAESTLPEFHRILRPRGWIALLWNTRDETDPFTQEYGRLVWSHTDRARTAAIHEGSPDALRASPLFETRDSFLFLNAQRLDEEELQGRAFSASYAPRDPERSRAYVDALRDLHRRHAHDGHVVLRYTTEVHLARRR